MIVRRNGEGSPAETDYEIFTSTTRRTMYFACITQHQSNLASHAHEKAEVLHNKLLSVHRYPTLESKNRFNYATKIL